MDFLNGALFALSADVTNIDVELPEELGMKVVETFGNVLSTMQEVATHFHGDRVTPDDYAEAGQLMVLYMRKIASRANENSEG